MQTDLEVLAEAIKQKNVVDAEIAQIIGRPAERGHVGEYIAARVFGITLEKSASKKGIDGWFTTGSLARKTVNIKWYGKMEGILDVTLEKLPDYYLVMAGPNAPAKSSRGEIRPWVISYVYLFNARDLIRELKMQGLKIGVAASVRNHLWEEAEVYPEQRNSQLLPSEDQKRLLALFR